MANSLFQEDLRLNQKYCLGDKASIKYVFEGMEEDLELFYEKFRQAQSLSFAAFATVWKELKFPSVFACRKHPTELAEFTDGLIHYGKAFLFSPQLPVSIFGLYFICSVIHKQTNKFMLSKLRLTLEELEQLEKILDKMFEGGHGDTQCIFKVMHDSGFIHYVAAPLEAGMEEGFKKYFEGTDEDRPNINHHSKPFDTSILDTLDTVNKLYAGMKDEICENKDNFFIDSGFVSMVRDQLDLLAKPEEKEKSKVEEDDDKTGQNRRLLKSKARTFAKNPKMQEKEMDKAEEGENKPKLRNLPRSKKMVLITETAAGTEPMQVETEACKNEDLPVLN